MADNETTQLSQKEIVQLSTQSRKKEKKTRKNFRWEEELIEKLISCLLEYKAQMTFQCIDFDADKPKMYSEIRIALAKLHPEVFGPEKETVVSENLAEEEIKEKRKAEKELINKGRNRIIEKIKEIRQSFSKAIVSGTRSGSGRIVYEHYEKLVELWGGSANTEPLPFGVTGDDFSANCSNSRDDIDTGDSSTHDITLNLNESDNTSLVDDSSKIQVEENIEAAEDYSSESSTSTSSSGKKRQSECVSRLVDNKRKHLQKNLSAAQRDKILIDEAKEDAMFRREMAEAIKESTKCFSESVNTLGASMVQMTNSIGRSIEVLAQALAFPNQTAPQSQPNFAYYPTQGHGYYMNMLNQENPNGMKK